ncbi:terpenoid synthase [Laetiporus sulphureus 93-53]|uniref:Terpenoid synthase n=1 Tax=Laetiporus sulphureus 93-53 TaxID=1314785 RepID=A0A165BIU7_9APHY|nr:terpenoid synthase [Laetiporus sulphureus 93-53]KZT01139.1 terpenoid synthase [Laetiporus sulphureus 93-53]
MNVSKINAPNAATVSQTVILDFLKKVDFMFPEYTRDAVLEARVKEAVQLWENGDLLRPHLVTAIILTATAHNNIPSLNTKVQITLFTTLIIAIDDPAVFNALGVRTFLLKMCTGDIQHNAGMLGEFTKILGHMWDHYSGFSANTIYASALRYINASLLENDFSGLPLSPDDFRFVEYKRGMRTTTEAYACFIWEKFRFPDTKVFMQAVPDVMLYVNYVNDILSFYKEELAGDTDTYIHKRASVTRKSVPETLQAVISDTVATVERIRDILGEGEVRDAWETFAVGYIGAYMVNPRYRLKDVLGGEYLMDASAFAS